MSWQFYLNGSAVTFQANDLSNQRVSTHADQLIHSTSSHVIGHDHRPGYLANVSAYGQSLARRIVVL